MRSGGTQRAGVDPRRIRNHAEFVRALRDVRNHSSASYRAIGAAVDRPVATINGWFTGRHLPYQRDNDVFEAVLEVIGVDDTAPWMEALGRLRSARESAPDITAPPPPRELIGRGHAVAWLDAHLLGSGAGRDTTRDTTRVVAIDGMPGVGKTALVLRWMWDRLSEFPDGAFFIDLRGGDLTGALEPETALRRLLLWLGEPSGALLGVDELVDRYRTITATGDRLVVLDNARDERQVRELLPSSGRCVVTSRRRLGGLHVRDGATGRRLGPLTAAEGAALLASRAEIDREQGGQIHAVCGGLPLGLHLAAELVAGGRRTVEELLAAADSGSVAASLDRAVDDAEAQLHTVFRQAISTRPTLEQQLLAGLAHAPCHAIDVAAIAALIGRSPDEAADVVAHLEAANLVRQVDADRYGLHDLLRSWIRDELPRPSTDADRLRRYYLLAVDRMDRELLPARQRSPLEPPIDLDAPYFANYDEAHHWGRREVDNIAAIVGEAVESSDVRLAARVAHISLSILNLEKPWSTWVAMYEAVHRQADRLPPLDAGNVANGLGIAYRETARIEAAVKAFQDAATAYERAGNISGQAMVLNNLALCRQTLGDRDQALDDLARAYALIRSAGDDFRISVVAHNLAEELLERSRFDEAIEHAQVAFDAAQRASDQGGAATTLTTLGEIEARQGRVADAERSFRAALDAQTGLGDRLGAAVTRKRFARLLRSTSRVAEALEFAEEALAEFVELGEQRHIGDSEEMIASLRAAASPPLPRSKRRPTA